MAKLVVHLLDGEEVVLTGRDLGDLDAAYQQAFGMMNQKGGLIGGPRDDGTNVIIPRSQVKYIAVRPD